MKLQTFALISGVIFILSGCGINPRPQAKPFIASSVITNDNVFHLLYTINNKNLHHLTQTDNGWEEEIFDFKEDLVKAFVKDNNICFSYSSRDHGVACIENHKLVTIDFNPEYWASNLLPNGELFHVSYGEDNIRTYYLYEPFNKKKTLLFTHYGNNILYNSPHPAEYTYPYLESNNTWDGSTLVSCFENNDQLQCALLNIEDNETVEVNNSIEFDASDIPDINRWWGGGTHYTQVKGKHYATPRTGVVIDVVDGTTLQVASAADYFGDDNLKILQDIDAVDANGTFHHLKTIQSYEHQELIYEKYIPSQTEPVYSEVIYKDKVEGEAW